MQPLRLSLDESYDESERQYVFLEFDPTKLNFSIVKVVRRDDDYSESRMSLEEYGNEASDSEKALLIARLREVFKP